MSHDTPPPGTGAQGAAEPVNPAVRFERTDANVGAIVKYAVGLVVLAVSAHLVVQVFFALMAAPAPSSGPMQPVPSPLRVRLPEDLKGLPAPRLQIDQERDLADLRRYEEDNLDNNNRFSWVEKGKVVRTPVAYAMQLLADPKTAEALGIRVRPVREEAGQPAKPAGRAKE